MLLRKAILNGLVTQLRTNRYNSSRAPFGSQRRRITEVEEEEEEEEAGEAEEEGDFSYTDVPRPGRKWERKPYVTPMKVLIRRAKEEKRARQENPCRVIEHPPDNGLLVPELIDVAHRVYLALESMRQGLSKLLHDHPDVPPILKCRCCSEVHIGHWGHEIRSCEGPKSASRNATHVWRRGGIRDVMYFPYCYHLYDRVGKPRVGHKERFGVQRLPAVVELCIQAGLELEDYPAKRRTTPVYSIEGRIVDFEPGKEDTVEEVILRPSLPIISTGNVNAFVDGEKLSVLSAKTLESWLEMRSGAKKIMEKYSVLTCGYCSEVQVGPKGHKVRMCKATKHQFRNGLHAWQEATMDDLIGPNYVWHVRNSHGTPLANELKRYYGKAPAIVELCVQAGARVPYQYRSMMRLDVMPPDRDEFDLVA